MLRNVNESIGKRNKKLNFNKRECKHTFGGECRGEVCDQAQGGIYQDEDQKEDDKKQKGKS